MFGDISPGPARLERQVVYRFGRNDYPSPEDQMNGQ